MNTIEKLFLLMFLVTLTALPEDTRLLADVMVLWSPSERFAIILNFLYAVGFLLSGKIRDKQ